MDTRKEDDNTCIRMSAIIKLNEQELQMGVSDSSSWHQDYRDTAWVRVTGLAPELTEGDVICVFSQFGEIEDINLIRDANTGKSRGLCFIKFERFKSAWLTVDNFNETILLDRTLRVDHYRMEFRRKKQHEGKTLQELLKEVQPGHYYENKEVEGVQSIHEGIDVYAARGQTASNWRADAPGESASRSEDRRSEDDEDDKDRRKQKKSKKEKKEKKEKRKKHRRSRSDSESSEKEGRKRGRDDDKSSDDD